MTDLLSDLKALVAKYDAAPEPIPEPTPDPVPEPVPEPQPIPVPIPDPQPVPTPQPNPVPMTPDVTNPAELAAAIAAAQPGAAITLAGGSYGALGLSGKSGLTLKSDPANPARFSTIALTKCTGMVLDGIAMSRPAQAGDDDNNVKALLLTLCDGVTIRNSDLETQKATSGAFAGFANGYTVYLDRSKNVTLTGNAIRGGRRAVMMQYADTVLVEGNDIHDFRAVAVGGGGNNRVTIRGNYLHDANPWDYPNSDHGDYIHLWDGLGKPPIVGTVIEDNTIMQGTGIPLMGISVQNTQHSGFVDVRVANNLILTADNQGIRFDGVQTIDVENNTIVTPIPETGSSTGKGGKARFEIGGAQGGKVIGNIWGSISNALPNCTVQNNLNTTYAQQAATFANPKGTTRADFVALATGPGAGLGIAP